MLGRALAGEHREGFHLFTPLEETMSALADVVRVGKAHDIGVSGWIADEMYRGHALARELRIPLGSGRPQHAIL